jgi:Fe-Mn family superoxide dismutase
MEYAPKTFTIPELEGISKENIEQHIGLYEGYVKNFNAMTQLLSDYSSDSEKYAHALSEITRRRSFEFGGMRLHEHYFPQLEGGATPLTPNGALAKVLSSEYGSTDAFVQAMKGIASMRGPGWAILYFDPEGQRILTGFTGEQHMGHFATLPILLALDVWEHSFILDYGAGGKGKYIDAFFKNLNWGVVERRFDALKG